MDEGVSIQREYYAKTASEYDRAHLSDIDEHFLALGWLASLIKLNKFESLLDVGAGTGRCLNFIKAEGISIGLVGVEPVAELREIGRKKGLGESEIIEGDALSLPFPDQSVDIVCSFGVLHHIKNHQRAVSEMCRVARRAIFISDCNNFAQGGVMVRAAKQAINAIGLWWLFDFIRTNGKGYHYSQGDGVYYSYSLISDVPTIRLKFPDVRFMSTVPSSENLYRTAPQLAVFAQSI